MRVSEERGERYAMDLRLVEEVAKEKPTTTTTTPTLHSDGADRQIDPSSALQSFLDHIPVSSIPGIRSHPTGQLHYSLSPLYRTIFSSSSSTVLELKTDDFVRDAIGLLFDENVSGAPVVDNMSTGSNPLSERDIGFIEFSSMALWSLEEIGKSKTELKSSSSGFLSMLEEVSEIGRTRIAELAKSFLWEPFFPVHSEDTLFHVLLLFSKHPRLKVVPVIASPNSHVIGFIAQNAVVQSLLQCNGLEWFDQIARKSLSEFGFEHSGFVRLYADQTLAEVFHIMWEKQVDGAPVVDRKTERLVGSVRCRDIHLLLEDDDLFKNRKTLNVEELIKVDAKSSSRQANLPRKGEPGVLCLKDSSLPPMSALITNRLSDSLKQVMENMVASKSERSFLVNESGQVEGVVTLRDIISQFSPPSMDSRIDGGGFFNTALEQVGCHVEDGSIIHNS